MYIGLSVPPTHHVILHNEQRQTCPTHWAGRGRSPSLVATDCNVDGVALETLPALLGGRLAALRHQTRSLCRPRRERPRRAILSDLARLALSWGAFVVAPHSRAMSPVPCQGLAKEMINMPREVNHIDLRHPSRACYAEG